MKNYNHKLSKQLRISLLKWPTKLKTIVLKQITEYPLNVKYEEPMRNKTALKISHAKQTEKKETSKEMEASNVEFIYLFIVYFLIIYLFFCILYIFYFISMKELLLI